MFDDRLFYFRGRVALHAILNALGVGKGDEVATQAFTCLAVPEGIMASGASPIYVDIEAGGVNMDAGDLRAKLSDRTRAIVVQHTFGIPADLDPILAVARERDLPVIEDCCHTYSSTYHGQRVGTFGAGAFYSFEWGKPVVAGIGGGAIVRDDLRDVLKRDHRRHADPGLKTQALIEAQYHVFKLLYRPALFWPMKTLFHLLSKAGVAKGNYNPIGDGNEPAEDFQLAMSPFARRRFERTIEQEPLIAEYGRWVAGQYADRIHSDRLQAAVVPEGAEVSWARYPIFVDDKERLIAHARRANLEVADWYRTPVHPLERAEEHKIGLNSATCPNAVEASRRILSLPTHPAVPLRYIDRVTRFLNAW